MTIGPRARALVQCPRVTTSAPDVKRIIPTPSAVLGRRVVGVTGFEPATEDTQPLARKDDTEDEAERYTKYNTTILEKLLDRWSKLRLEVRVEIACLAGLSEGDETGNGK